MKRIGLRVGNGLLAEAIRRALLEQSDFQVVKICGKDEREILRDVAEEEPDMVLLEVSYRSGYEPGAMLSVCDRLSAQRAACKVLFFCDATSCPEIARHAMQWKQDGRIQDCILTSTTLPDLVAALQAL